MDMAYHYWVWRYLQWNKIVWIQTQTTQSKEYTPPPKKKEKQNNESVLQKTWFSN